MSIISAVCNGDSAIVVTDTDVRLPDGKRGHVSKLLLLPHCNAVMVGRGSVMTNSYLHAALTMSAWDYDEITERMQSALKTAFGLTQSQGEFGPSADIAQGAEVALCGYSPKAGRVVLNLYRSYDGGKTIEAHSDIPNALAPADDIRTDDLSPDRDGLIALAGRQIEAIRKHHPGAAAGGRLVIATVSKASTLIESIDDYPR